MSLCQENLAFVEWLAAYQKLLSITIIIFTQ